VKPVYYETREGLWRPLSEIVAHHGNRNIVLKPEAMSRASLRYIQWLAKRQSMIEGGLLEFGYPDTFYWGVQPRDLYTALSLVAYPDADPETTTVDGYVGKAAGSWAAAHDASNGTSADTSATTLSIRGRWRSSASEYQIDRTFVLFDTSSIGDTDTITAATLDLYVTAVTNADNDGDDYLALASSSPATNTALITTDFNDVGSTEYGSVPDLGALTASAYNTITLTETGRNTISKTGVSKFSVREGHDMENVAPVDDNRVVASSADETGTSQDPKLTVTYTAAGAVGALLGVIFF